MFLTTQWLQTSLDRLKEIANLPDNWNGEGSPPTNPDIVEAAEKLLQEIAQEFDCESTHMIIDVVDKTR